MAIKGRYQYEYLNVTRWPRPDDEETAWLNERGAEGWQLVSALGLIESNEGYKGLSDVSTRDITYYFRRPRARCRKGECYCRLEDLRKGKCASYPD